MQLMRKDTMIDLETLGVKAHAPILSIGACNFDIMTGTISSTFYFAIGWEQALHNQAGRIYTQDTIDWWEKQSEEAQQAVKRTHGTLTDALGQLSIFLNGDEHVWGNGSTFDITILEHAYDQLSIETPWKYWKVRDVRTVVDISSDVFNKDMMKFGGVQHNALDDAIHQAKYVSEMWKRMKKCPCLYK